MITHFIFSLNFFETTSLCSLEKLVSSISAKLSLSIMELINDEEKCIKLGNSGYKLVTQQCNSKVMVNQTLKMYEQIIK